MRFISVDIGNTNPHVGIFLNDKLSAVIPLANYIHESEDIISVSSVKKVNTIAYQFNLKDYLKDKKFFDMKVNYTETLGIDRLICGYKAFIDFSSSKTIIVDAGTFMTIDLVDKTGFNGGYILPGIGTFLSSYTNGELLPKLEYSKLDNNEIPHSTEEAILGGLHIYLESSIGAILKKTSPNRIVLTGGGAEKINEIIKKINSKIEIQLDPHYLHQANYLIYSRHLKYLKAL